MNWRATTAVFLVIAALRSVDAATNSLLPVTPPLPTVATSTTDLWRRVLAMNEAEREAFIMSKPAASQAYLRSKVQEYLSLSPEQREARLRALELRADMLPLMSMSDSNRTRQLQTLPEPRRREIQERLATWVILPPPLQEDVLKNEAAMRLVVDAAISGITREQMLATVPPHRRPQVERELDAWNSLPESRQEQMLNNFKRFFIEEPESRNKTLMALKDSERAKVMPTLTRIEQLSHEQRDQALQGFRKFKNMRPADQQDFLKAAERWQAMSEKDRQLWRKLVAQLRTTSLPIPPPIPPARVRVEASAGN